jgi:hypothetical protein
MVHRLVITLLLISMPTLPALADVVRMPPGLEPRAFQEVVDSAAYGDTVIVPPGEYMQIVLRSGLTVIAEKGPEETVLRSVLADEVDSLTVIEGFHVKGKARPVAVVSAEESGVTVRGCVIEGGFSGVQVRYGNVRVENCRITDCDNGLWFFESKGVVSSCEIVRCGRGIHLMSSSPRILRSEIAHNAIGLEVKDHSLPSVGGSLATANRFHHNRMAHVSNESYVKRDAMRTWEPLILPVPVNYWGTECPSEEDFRGDVVFRPWVGESGSAVLEECPADPSEPAVTE